MVTPLCLPIPRFRGYCNDSRNLDLLDSQVTTTKTRDLQRIENPENPYSLASCSGPGALSLVSVWLQGWFNKRVIQLLIELCALLPTIYQPSKKWEAAKKNITKEHYHDRSALDSPIDLAMDATLPWGQAHGLQAAQHDGDVCLLQWKDILAYRGHLITPMTFWSGQVCYVLVERSAWCCHGHVGALKFLSYLI